MCRHLLHYLRLLVSCVDTSSLHSSVLIHCLHVSTLQFHVSTLDHQFFKLWPLITCVYTSDSCVDSWSFIFKTLALSLCVDTLKSCVDTFISRIIFLCTIFMCRHLLPRTYFHIFLGQLSFKQFKIFKRSSLRAYMILKVFNPVRFIRIHFTSILDLNSSLLITIFWVLKEVLHKLNELFFWAPSISLSKSHVFNFWEVSFIYFDALLNFFEYKSYVQFLRGSIQLFWCIARSLTCCVSILSRIRL